MQQSEIWAISAEWKSLIVITDKSSRKIRQKREIGLNNLKILAFLAFFAAKKAALQSHQ